MPAIFTMVPLSKGFGRSARNSIFKCLPSFPPICGIITSLPFLNTAPIFLPTSFVTQCIGRFHACTHKGAISKASVVSSIPSVHLFRTRIWLSIIHGPPSTILSLSSLLEMLNWNRSGPSCTTVRFFGYPQAAVQNF